MLGGHLPDRMSGLCCHLERGRADTPANAAGTEFFRHAVNRPDRLDGRSLEAASTSEFAGMAGVGLAETVPNIGLAHQKSPICFRVPGSKTLLRQRTRIASRKSMGS